SYSAATDDWLGTITLLEPAAPLVADRGLAERYTSSIATCRENSRVAALDRARERQAAEELELSATCWFCKKRPADPAKPSTVPLFGDVKRERVARGVEVTWRNDSVSVPRCTSCCKRQERALPVLTLVFATCMAAYIGLRVEPMVAWLAISAL